MNEKFRTIGLDTEDKITEFIDYIDDLEDTEEIKSDVYGFFEEELQILLERYAYSEIGGTFILI